MTKPTQPPTPKYWFDEHVMFDRSHLSYASDEDGPKIGVVNDIEVRIAHPKSKPVDTKNVPGQWQILYCMKDIDDQVPEECILGPCVLGEKR